MFLQMSHRQLLEAGSTLQTRHYMLRDTFTPMDRLWSYHWRSDSNVTVRLFLGFEGLQTGIGVLESCMHIVWCESVRFNLCHHEVFRHFEQSLGHGTFFR